MINKKANILMNEIVFIIIVVLFSAIMLLYVTRSGNANNIIEQKYAKDIALDIDKALSGTSLILNMSEVVDYSKNNKYHGQIVNISSSKKEVKVSLGNGLGYSQRFFNDNIISWKLDNENKMLYIDIIKK